MWPLRGLALVGATLLLVLGAVDVAGAGALPSGFPNQSQGNRGVNVKALQHLLRQHGATIRVSAVFDDATVQATRAFQHARGRPETGVADASTWGALVVQLRGGSTGEAVLAVKRLLDEKRHAGLALTTTFDAATRSAVLTFQGHAGITKTGVVDMATWKALLSHLDLPVWGTSLCDYSVGNGAANWGTGAAIGQLQSASHLVVAAGYGRVALGDVGFEHGGPIPGHETHQQGMDVDVRPMRDANDQCKVGTDWRYASYDRTATRALVKAIRASAPGHVKLIYFNDPVLIREGLTTWYSGHDNHLHIRYCERVYPIAAYVC